MSSPSRDYLGAFEQLLSGDPDASMQGAAAMRDLRKEKGYLSYVSFVQCAFAESDISRVMELLENPNRDVRLEAALLLRGANHEGVRERLLELADRESDSFVRSAIVINIGDFGDERDIPLMATFLNDPDDRVRANAIDALGKINDTRIVEHVLPYLDDSNNRVRANALKLLYRFQRVDRVFEALKEMITSGDERMRTSAVYLLREIDTVKSLDLILNEDAETFMENREKNLEFIRTVEARESLEGQLESLALEIETLEGELDEELVSLPQRARDKIKALADFRAKHSSLSTHRMHLSTIGLSLQRQIEIEALHEKLKCSMKDLEMARTELEQLNHTLEGLVESKTRALQESKEFTENILRSLNAGVIVVNRDLRILEMNPAARSILRIKGSIEGARISDFPFTSEFLPFIESVFGDLKPLPREEMTIARKGEESRIIGLSASPVVTRAGDVIGVVAAFQDITHTKGLEAKLIQAEKMKTVGMLSSSIAHDFNNLLMGILGFSSLLIEDHAEDHDLFESLSMIHSSALEAKEIVVQLLSLSRTTPPAKETVSMADLIVSTLKVAKVSFPEGQSLTAEIESGVPLVLGDRAQLSQVILNLLLNARDSMAGKTGEVEVFLGRETLSDAQAEKIFSGDRGGDFVVLKVRDQGCGIQKEDLPRIFEPFYTTKTGGKGTGLGCTIVYNVSKRHGGGVSIDSSPGKGTVFTVYLPATTIEASAVAKENPIPDLMGLRVWIIEDEPVAMKFVGETLVKAGVEVVGHSSGEEAVDSAGWATGKPDLLLVDMYLPGMDGLRCVETLAGTREGIPPVLFMSGHASRDTFERAIAKFGGSFIQKPFTKHELLEAVAEVLSGRTIS